MPKATKKPESKKLGVEVDKSKSIKRDGYTVFFVKPSDEATRNELRNTGKVFNEVSVDSKTDNDGIDEIVVFVKD